MFYWISGHTNIQFQGSWGQNYLISKLSILIDSIIMLNWFNKSRQAQVSHFFSWIIQCLGSIQFCKKKMDPGHDYF